MMKEAETRAVKLFKSIGAGDGIRTRDGLLGRQVLYQPELLPQNQIHFISEFNCRQRVCCFNIEAAMCHFSPRL
jgi:hypothetical protein